MTGFDISTSGGGEGKKVIRRRPIENGNGITLSPTDEINYPSEWLYKDIGTAYGFPGGSAPWKVSDTISSYNTAVISYTPSSWVGLFRLYFSRAIIRNLYVNGEGKTNFPSLNRTNDYVYTRLFDVQKYSPAITITAYNFQSYSGSVTAFPVIPNTIINDSLTVVWPERLSGYYAAGDF